MLNPFNNPEVQEQLSVLFSNLAGDIWATLYSTVLATIFAYIIGLPLGILLVTGEKGGVRPLPGALMKVLNFVINILRSVPFLILEAAQAMGASPFQIVRKVLLPEALPSLLTSATTVTITILGYGAMAGIIGGNGLGATAINYGYYRNQPVILYGAVIVLVILVQIIQSAGTHTAVGSDKRLTKKSRRKGLRDANRQVNRDKRTPGAM